MAVIETIYPVGLSNINKKIVFSTDITTGSGGHESRNANWQDALHVFDAASGIRNRADIQSLAAFFYTVRGRETAFLLQDLEDYAIPSSGSTPQNIGTGDGSDLTFQIFKRYSNVLGGVYDRIIERPSATTSDLAVYVNGVLKTHTTHYTYSTSTGIITFTGGNAPPNGHAVTITLAKFYVPVRFDTDELETSLLVHWLESGVPYSQAEVPQVPMREVRD